MEYKIVGDVMQALQIQLHSGEEVYAEAGTMLYMGPGINLQARMQGGLMKGLMRKFLAGETMFMSVFRCDAASGHLANALGMTQAQAIGVITLTGQNAGQS